MAEPVQVRFTLHSRDQRSKWMQNGCKFYMDSYMASNGSCFMVTWIIFKNHLLEVGLTQNQETMALQYTQLLIYSILSCVRPPAWIEIHRDSIWSKARSHMTSHYTWGGSVTTLHDVGGVLERPLDTFFWALTISWSRLLARVWSGPNNKKRRESAKRKGTRIWNCWRWWWLWIPATIGLQRMMSQMRRLLPRNIGNSSTCHSYLHFCHACFLWIAFGAFLLESVHCRTCLQPPQIATIYTQLKLAIIDQFLGNRNLLGLIIITTLHPHNSQLLERVFGGSGE